jgi:hypothetical protein
MAPDGRVFIYREMYEAGVQVPDQAKRIRALLERTGERLDAIKADPAMFNKAANLAVSDAQRYAQQGIGLTRGTNAREAGWRRVSEFLQPMGEGLPPGLVVLEGNAPKLVETLPVLLADPDRPEDIKHLLGAKQEDHAADALRYLLMPAAAKEQTLRAVPMETRLDARVTDDRELEAQLNYSGVKSEW